MKTLRIFIAVALLTSLLTSCFREEIIVDNNNPVPTVTLNQLLNSYDLWYVDINQTLGYGETPFLQIAFTVSFRNGIMYANNNLVGFGTQGNGLGIPVGEYDAYGEILDIYHDIDGYETFDVFQIDGNTIELYNPFNDTSYFLHGYQRHNFDYDFIFYDNIHYFLQEYRAWEKTFTSNQGSENEFDYENYLQFLAGGNDSTFRSSQDVNGLSPNNIYWDYTGQYTVGDISNNMYLKTLTLDYNYFNGEFFELNVINDQRIELYHPSSGTFYEFTGSGYIEFIRTSEENNGKKEFKKRKQFTKKKENPRINTRA